MKSPESVKFDRTQESIFTLLSLCVLTVQAFESLFGEEDILNANFDIKAPVFQEMVNDTIREALIYQILLKTCSYLDEWDKVFGVKTESRDKEKILKVKRIVRPAYKSMTSWRQLREFRNQAIAHNHRDKSGENIYLNQKTWHSPQTDEEILLLVYCVKSITDVVNFFFPEVARMPLSRKDVQSCETEFESVNETNIKDKMKEINLSISENLKKNGAFQ